MATAPNMLIDNLLKADLWTFSIRGFVLCNTGKFIDTLYFSLIEKHKKRKAGESSG